MTENTWNQGYCRNQRKSLNQGENSTNNGKKKNNNKKTEIMENSKKKTKTLSFKNALSNQVLSENSAFCYFHSFSTP